METTINDPTINEGDILNIELSTSNPFGLIPFLGSLILITTIPTIHIRNTKPILSINGISKTPFEFGTAKPNGFKNDKLTKAGINLKIIDIIKPPIVANKAAFEVVLFQKKPRMNIAKTPGPLRLQQPSPCWTLATRP